MTFKVAYEGVSPAVAMLADIGINVDPADYDIAQFDYVDDGGAVTFDEMTDREIMEAHGIDVDHTPVDAFINKGMGWSALSSMRDYD